MLGFQTNRLLKIRAPDGLSSGTDLGLTESVTNESKQWPLATWPVQGSPLPGDPITSSNHSLTNTPLPAIPMNNRPWFWRSPLMVSTVVMLGRSGIAIHVFP